MKPESRMEKSVSKLLKSAKRQKKKRQIKGAFFRKASLIESDAGLIKQPIDFVWLANHEFVVFWFKIDLAFLMMEGPR